MTAELTVGRVPKAWRPVLPPLLLLLSALVVLYHQTVASMVTIKTSTDSMSSSGG